jgi:hypothetical protein
MKKIEGDVVVLASCVQSEPKLAPVNNWLEWSSKVEDSSWTASIDLKEPARETSTDSVNDLHGGIPKKLVDDLPAAPLTSVKEPCNLTPVDLLSSSPSHSYEEIDGRGRQIGDSGRGGRRIRSKGPRGGGYGGFCMMSRASSPCRESLGYL